MASCSSQEETKGPAELKTLLRPPFFNVRAILTLRLAVQHLELTRRRSQMTRLCLLLTPAIVELGECEQRPRFLISLSSCH